MSQPQQQAPTPAEPLREGSRWRYRKPSSEEVAAWFDTVPLDEGMEHGKYVSGVVVIKATEKVKQPKPDGRGQEEKFEDTYTPYVRVDTRVTYFRQLAEKLDLVAVIEPVEVPRITEGAFKNDHMPPGFWWHIMGESNAAQRFLCCTMRVALYREEDWFPADQPKVTVAPEDVAERGPIEIVMPRPRPVREGVATKQVPGGPDINALAKAETGAIGRALGVAGILVVGTGIATAEDIAELREPQAEAPVLPAAGDGESEEQLNERLIELQARLRLYPDAWREFAAWWSERSKQGGYTNPLSTPIEVRRGMASKMTAILAELPDEPPTPVEAPPEDSSQPTAEPEPTDPDPHEPSQH